MSRARRVSLDILAHLHAVHPWGSRDRSRAVSGRSGRLGRTPRTMALVARLLWSRAELRIHSRRGVHATGLILLNEKMAALATRGATGELGSRWSRRFGATRSRRSRDGDLLKDSLIDFFDVVATRRDVARDGAALSGKRRSPSIGSSAQVPRVRAGGAEVARAERRANARGKAASCRVAGASHVASR